VGRGDLRARLSYSYQSDVTATTEVTVDPITHAVVEPIHQDGYGLLGAGLIWRNGGAGRSRCRAAISTTNST
jgi:iron complex outermembrane receptor protein